MREIKSTEWDNQFISKKEIYNTLREVSSSYGACCSVDKQSAVFRCINALMVKESIEVGRCEKCIHYEFGVCLKIYDDGNESKDAWQRRKPDDYCSYFKSREEE